MIGAVFANMANEMISVPGQDLKVNSAVSHADYLTWQHGFVFDALQGLRYGQSFCNHFDITDNILFYERDPEWSDVYIRSHYVL
jgi:hypothetical protein